MKPERSIYAAAPVAVGEKQSGTVVPLSDRLSRRQPGEAPSWVGRPRDSSTRPLFSRPALAPEVPVAAAAPRDPADDPEFQRQLAEARARAEEEGRRAGSAQVEIACDRYLEAVHRLEKTTREASRPSASEVVGLAMVVARELLGRELRTDREALVAAVDAALLAAGREAPVRVRMARADLDYISRKRRDLVEGGVQLVEDATLQPGGCIVETPRRVVDATLDARLASVKAALVRVLDESQPEVERESERLSMIAGRSVA